MPPQEQSALVTELYEALEDAIYMADASSSNLTPISMKMTEAHDKAYKYLATSEAKVLTEDNRKHLIDTMQERISYYESLDKSDLISQMLEVMDDASLEKVCRQQGVVVGA